ncbi:molybdenum cofactor biosynthesis protein MoaE [Corynebacterium camporealensis]
MSTNPADPSYVAQDTGVLLGAEISNLPLQAPDISTPTMGAVVRFDGIVRNHDGGHGGVELLTYTCHPSAPQRIQEVAKEVLKDHPDVRLWCAHRIGDLQVGDAAFIVLAASAHRQAAFDAASTLADRVKAEVPIWKEQQFNDGNATWVGLE